MTRNGGLHSDWLAASNCRRNVVVAVPLESGATHSHTLLQDWGLRFGAEIGLANGGQQDWLRAVVHQSQTADKVSRRALNYCTAIHSRTSFPGPGQLLLFLLIVSTICLSLHLCALANPFLIWVW